MKRIWIILIALLVLAAAVLLLYRPDIRPGKEEEGASASEEIEASPVAELPAASADPSVQVTEEPAEEELPEEEDVEESEYVEDYTVEVGDDEVFEIG